MQRRTLVASAAAILASRPRGAAAQGSAEGFPSRPIRLVHPYAPGGFTDVLARGIAERLQRDLGQPVLVDNRPGANTMIAARAVAASAPDGYTLGWVALPGLTTNFHFYPDTVGYRRDDFQPITLAVRAPNVLAIHPDTARDLAHFLELARARREPFAYAVNGIGGSSQLCVEILQRSTGVRLDVVSYRADAAAVLDVLGKRIAAFSGSLGNVLEHHRAGRLRILGTTAAERTPGLDDVPTFREAGVPDLVYIWWHGIAARAGTPRPVVDRLHAAIAAAMADPALRAGLPPDVMLTPTTPEEFAELIERDYVRLGELIRARGITVD